MNPLEILKKYRRPVPRYTSYPTAPFFKADVGKTLTSDTLADLNIEHDTVSGSAPISIYIHIPYCDRLCWFCGCHTKQTQRYEPVTKYVDHLIGEIELYRQKLAFKPAIAHLHFGGGSPSVLHSEDFQRIRDALDQTFEFSGNAEISVEIDPNDHSEDLMAGLKLIGVTRASIGVQDFNETVQAAIKRPQTFEQTSDLVTALRASGISSINIDALYGLPFQTMTTLKTTIQQVISIKPDRIAMFGYAHVPWVKKHQQMIAETSLPDTFERFDQSQLADQMLIESGYGKIGIDHYTLSHDPLATAKENGSLRRNFQGYTHDHCKTMLAFGASSIGASDNGYWQNLVPTGQYLAEIAAGRLPSSKGYLLSDDDRIRSFIIERLMCDFKVTYEDVSREFGSFARPYILEMKAMAGMEKDGLCDGDADSIFIPTPAYPFTRIVAARFDAYLESSDFKFSKAV